MQNRRFLQEAEKFFGKNAKTVFSRLHFTPRALMIYPSGVLEEIWKKRKAAPK